MAAVTFPVGKQFAIRLASGGGGSSVCSVLVHAEVVAESEKSVQVRAVGRDGNLSKETCWVPRRALVPVRGAEGIFTFAGWFRLSDYQARFVNRHTSFSALCA